MREHDTRTILAIPGSLRRGSFNRGLLEAAAESAPGGMTITLYDGLASLPPFDEDLERETSGGPEPVRRLRGLVRTADGLLLATPEYNQSFPGVLKNAIDWLSIAAPDEVLAGKPVAVVGATPGRWGTRLAQAALRQVLHATEAPVLPAPTLFVRDAAQLFDESGRLTDEPTRAALRVMLSSFDRWIDTVARRPDALGSSREESRDDPIRARS